MTTLTNTQMTLLDAASQRQDGCVLPLPDKMILHGGIRRSLEMLLARGLVEERETISDTAAFRIEGRRSIGLFITPAGAVAVAAKLSGAGSSKGAEERAAGLTYSAAKPASVERTTKTATVFALLSRAEGATLLELMEVTSWLAHTVRAALTGFRQKGHTIVRCKRDGVTCYIIQLQE